MTGEITDSDDDSWQIHPIKPDGSSFKVTHGGSSATVNWNLTGNHNMSNAMAAILAARHVGVTPEIAAEALGEFGGVKRRMELLGKVGNISVYDDFAHHPTAITTTLEGIRKRVGEEKIIALIEPRSNTMKLGVHKQALAESAIAADEVVWANTSGMDWLPEVVEQAGQHCESSIDALIARVLDSVAPISTEKSGHSDVHLVIMSNGGFGGIHQKILEQLREKF